MRLPKLLVLGEKVGRENDISKETCLRVFNLMKLENCLIFAKNCTPPILNSPHILK